MRPRSGRDAATIRLSSSSFRRTFGRFARMIFRISSHNRGVGRHAPSDGGSNHFENLDANLASISSQGKSSIPSKLEIAIVT